MRRARASAINRDTRGGTPDELHLAQIENDQVRVGLGRT
jgi:hypothetical protein